MTARIDHSDGDSAVTVNDAFLYVALDDATVQGCYEKASQVCDVSGDFGFKLNQDVLLEEGVADLVHKFTSRYRRPVFADIKMWNGGRTMEATIANLVRAGAAITNVYAHAGVKAIQRALKGAEGSEMKVFGLGILTHYTEDYCQTIYRRSLKEMVRIFGEISAEADLPGYILPGTCLDQVADLPFVKLVPAVRPTWFEDTRVNNQEQTVTPAEAFRGGAHIVVCGSPIFKSPDPRVALERILEEIKSVSS